MGRGGTALGIIGIIIASGAVGFSFVVLNGQNITNSDIGDLTDELNNLTDELNNLTDVFNNLTEELNNLGRIIVVGVWDALEDNIDFAPHNTQNDWLLEFGDNILNDTDYISVSNTNTNTNVTLLKSGWYRIHLSVLLTGINPSSTYWIRLYVNGTLTNYMARHETSAASPIFHHIDASAFVYSDGTNYIEINGYSNGDNFNAGSDDRFNQLTIEYVII